MTLRRKATEALKLLGIGAVVFVLVVVALVISRALWRLIWMG